MTKFKDALDDYNNSRAQDYTKSETVDTIRLALLIADKVMQEPSDKTKFILGYQIALCADKTWELSDENYKVIFRAMIEQMILELKS